MKEKNHMDEGRAHERERDTITEGDKQPERGRNSRGCRVHRRYGNERIERERKGGKVREKCKKSDAKRRGGGQMREGSCRVGKGCEARGRGLTEGRVLQIAILEQPTEG